MLEEWEGTAPPLSVPNVQGRERPQPLMVGTLGGHLQAQPQTGLERKVRAYPGGMREVPKVASSAGCGAGGTQQVQNSRAQGQRMVARVSQDIHTDSRCCAV